MAGTDHPQRRCTDCSEHSGIVRDLAAGEKIMTELKEDVKQLRADFTEYTTKQSKWTISILVGIIMLLLAQFGGYIKKSGDTETTKILREIVQIMKDDE